MYICFSVPDKIIFSRETSPFVRAPLHATEEFTKALVDLLVALQVCRNVEVFATAADAKPDEIAIPPVVFPLCHIDMDACEFIVFSVFSVCSSGEGSAVLYHLRTHRCVVAKGGQKRIFVARFVLDEEVHATFGTNGSSVCAPKVLI
jgi:hypothetical protein